MTIYQLIIMVMNEWRRWYTIITESMDDVADEILRHSSC